MIQATANNVIVSVKTKWIKDFSDLAKRAAIENNSSVDPADYAQIVGKVEGLPSLISPNNKYKGFSTKDIRVGDMAIFSYKVIYDMVTQEAGCDPLFRNQFFFEGKEYFLADIKHIFGIIRDGEIIMVNGWLMLTEIEKSAIHIPVGVRKVKNAACSEVMYESHSKTHLPHIGVHQGDKVFYDPKSAQHYEINGKKFIIMPQEKILGKVKAEKI